MLIPIINLLLNIYIVLLVLLSWRTLSSIDTICSYQQFDQWHRLSDLQCACVQEMHQITFKINVNENNVEWEVSCLFLLMLSHPVIIPSITISIIHSKPLSSVWVTFGFFIHVYSRLSVLEWVLFRCSRWLIPLFLQNVVTILWDGIFFEVWVLKC